MKRGLIVLVVVLACLFGLFLVTGLVASSLVSGSGKQRLVTSLEQSVGVPVTVGNASFDLKQWFLLKPAITIENVAIGNPPGFRSRNLLEAKSLSAQIALMPLLHKILEVHSIVIDEPRFSLETNAQGLSNLEAFLRKTKGKPGVTPAAAPGSASESTTGTGLVVDQFSIKSGDVSIAQAGLPSLNVTAIDLEVRDFSRDQPFHVQLSARLFGSGSSRLQLAGQAGPMTADSLPLKGTLLLVVAPIEIPAAIRRAQFGNLLGAPGAKATSTLEVTISGDAYQRLSGPAKLALSGIMIGKDQAHVLPLAGEAPVGFTASRLMSAPAFQLSVSHAQLRLGKGEWAGGANLELRGTATSGRSSGSIRNVDMNELLGALTPASEKIYGVLEVPSYTLDFAGKNADEVRNSLHGAAKLSIAQGRIAALDLLGSIERALAHPEEALSGEKGATPFTTLAADLGVNQRRLSVDNIQLDNPALRVNGKGTIDFDENLNFDLSAHLTGGVATPALSKVAATSSGGGIPLTVTGTVASPKVRPSVGKMVNNVAQGLLDSFLKPKKPK